MIGGAVRDEIEFYAIGPRPDLAKEMYSYHFVCTRHESPFAEFLMMAPDAASVVPMFTPLLTGEPLPVSGRIRVSALDRPGFGVELDRSLPLERPFRR